MALTCATRSPRRLLVPLALLLASGCKSCDDDPCAKNPAGPTCPIPQGTIAVTVSGLPSGAPAAVTVDGGTVSETITASRTVAVPPGSYTLRARPVQFAGRVYFEPDSVRTITVSNGQNVPAPVSYGPITPVLLARAAGLPAGIVAPWALGGGGQGDFGVPIGNVASVSLQPNRDYVIRAGGFLSNSQLYGPTPASIAFRSEAGVQADLQVNWAPVTTVEDFSPSLNGIGGSALGGLSGVIASSRFFRVVVGAGATRLRITTSGGTGDADLYCRLGAPPVFPPAGTSGFGEGPTNVEECAFDNPPAGPWYAMVVGGSSPFQGVSLGADLTLPASTLTIAAGAGSTGSGTVTVQSPGGGAAQVCTITNGTVASGCTQTWSPNTPVTLTAAATGSSGFVSWTGACNGAQSTCNLTTGGPGTNTTATALFQVPVAAATLAVTPGGGSTGSGTVTGQPQAGGPNQVCTITNGAVASGCTQTWPANTPLTLTAAATGSSGFVSWTGACAGVQVTCNLTLGGGGSTTTATAVFQAPALAVNPATLTFNGIEAGGNPTPQIVTVTNSGGGGAAAISGLVASVSYQAGEPPGWLAGAAVALNKTTTAANLTVAPTTGALLIGVYHATITVTSSAGAKAVAVVYQVAAQPTPIIGIETSQFAVNQGFRYPGTDQFNLQVANLAGGGALTLTAPSVAYLETSRGWLTASAIGSQLTLNVALANGTSVTVDPLSARVTVGALGATSTTVDVKLYRANSSLGLVAGSRVYFHFDPAQILAGNPTTGLTSGLSALVSIPGSSAGPATGVSIAAVWDGSNQPVTPTWTLSPSVDGQNRVVLTTKDAASANPTPQAFFVLVSTSKSACISRNPACTIAVKYTYNPDPRLRFDRFGLVFSTGGVSPQSVNVDAYNLPGIPGSSTQPDSLVINSVAMAVGCPFVTPTLPPAGPGRVIKSTGGGLTKVAMSFATNVSALAPNTTVDCTAFVDWTMWKDTGGGPQVVGGSQKDSLVTTVTRLPLETILPQKGDLRASVRISAGLRTFSIPLQNLGGFQITSLAVVAQGATCAPGAIVPSLSGTTTIGPEGVTNLSVALNPAGLAPGLCTATLQVTGQAPSGLLTTTIPVNFTVLP